MNSEAIIKILKNKISEQLVPLINNNYVLWDLPYHTNIGDTYIWEGELDFLKELPYKMLHQGSKDTVTFPKLKSDIIILLHGGGNFGDIYHHHQEFRNRVIKKYPQNKIIVLPQTVFYSSKLNLDRDKKILNRHKNLSICVRDEESKNILLKHLPKVNILLVPDMAFYIDLSKWTKYISKPQKDILYVKRQDIELTEAGSQAKKGDIKDWPTIEKHRFSAFIIKLLTSFLTHTEFLGKINHPVKKLFDFYTLYYLKNKQIKIGIQFLSNYRIVYSNRLHAIIIRILIEKKVVIMDNSYGKNTRFAKTWFKGLNEISFYEKEISS